MNIAFEELFKSPDDTGILSERARRKGRFAYISGGKLSDNPYISRKYMAHNGWWIIGYNEAKEIITEKLNSGV